MTRDEVVAKCRDLMGPFLGRGVSTKLIDAVLAVETAKDIRSLRPMLQRG